MNVLTPKRSKQGLNYQSHDHWTIVIQSALPIYNSFSAKGYSLKVGRGRCQKKVLSQLFDNIPHRAQQQSPPEQDFSGLNSSCALISK